MFDTNILLNLYRYTVGTRDELLSAMQTHQEKLWLPYQVGFEYFNKRLDIIDKMANANTSLKESLDSLRKTIEDDFNKDYAHHPLIKREEFFAAYDEAINSIKEKLDEWMQNMPSYKENDIILTRLLGLYDDKVGDDYPENKLEEIYKEGEKRYEKDIPPGYKDGKTKKNEGPRHQYGDLIIWKQMIDYSTEQNKDVIFVTEDQKDDWWYKRNGEIVSPRAELLREFHKETEHELLMFRQNTFLTYAQVAVNETTKIEVDSVSEADRQAYSKMIIDEVVQNLLATSKAVPPSPIQPEKTVTQLLTTPLQSIIDSQKKIDTIVKNPLSLTIADIVAAQPKVPSINELITKMAIGNMPAWQVAAWQDVLNKGK